MMTKCRLDDGTTADRTAPDAPLPGIASGHRPEGFPVRGFDRCLDPPDAAELPDLVPDRRLPTALRDTWYPLLSLAPGPSGGAHVDIQGRWHEIRFP